MVGSASAKALPKTMPVSSMVWWQSTSQSPTVFTLRPKFPWTAKALSMWSKKPTPVEMARSPPSRQSSRVTSVSLVFRCMDA